MMSEYDYDVVIIGGGPAGSTVARYAAESGIKTLVIDARKSIGSPLQCGELVPTNDEMRRLCPDVPDMDDLFRTPDEAISRRTDFLSIITPSGKSLKYDFDGLVLNRVKHDEALVELAKKSGADAVKFQTHYADSESTVQEKFRKGEIKVLLLNTSHFGAGLDLHMTTDLIDCLIMYSNCNECFTNTPAAQLLELISNMLTTNF